MVCVWQAGGMGLKVASFSMGWQLSTGEMTRRSSMTWAVMAQPGLHPAALTCLCPARGFSSGLSPLEEEDCCRSRAPGPAQSGEADARVPLEGRGYCRVLSRVGGVRPRGAGGGGGGGGGGWSILRWGPALFCRGTAGCPPFSVSDICRRASSPGRRPSSSAVLLKLPSLAAAANSSLLLWELRELWPSEPESPRPRGDRGRPAAIW